MPSVPSLLSEERQTNPFLRCSSPEIIQQISQYANRTLQQPIEVFAEMRKWKDNF